MFEFTLDGRDGEARAGTLTLPHGIVRTPCFMPVGTRGAVRGLHPAEVEAAPTTPPDALVEADLLVEDVSIDGMCGVY